MLLPVKGLAPISFGPALSKPQLVTPMTTFASDDEPPVVPVSFGRTPKLTIQGPPLDPPHISEPMIVLFW